MALGDDDTFTTWPKAPERPTPDALRVDARLVAGGGEATWVSWCRFDGEGSLPFDDGAVSGALRRRLAAPAWPEAVSTLLVDWSRIAGAITTATDERAVRADPFARVFPRRILRVPAGTFGPIPAPTGPGITRYGSGNPWPWDRYAGQAP
jgi:hypothetical protein